MSVLGMIHRLFLLAVCVGMVALGLVLTLEDSTKRHEDSAAALVSLGLFGMVMLFLEAVDLLKGQRAKSPGDDKQGEGG